MYALTHANNEERRVLRTMKVRLSLGMLGMLGLLSVACVHTVVTQLGTPMARPIVPMDQVKIYRTAGQVPGKYEEVALLNSSASSGWTNEESMFKNMRFQAGQAGANAVVLDAISEPSAGAKIAAAVIGVGAERKGKAIAIYILPPEKQ
jgi:hypothetical protein